MQGGIEGEGVSLPCAVCKIEHLRFIVACSTVSAQICNDLIIWFFDTFRYRATSQAYAKDCPLNIADINLLWDRLKDCLILVSTEAIKRKYIFKECHPKWLLQKENYTILFDLL